MPHALLESAQPLLDSCCAAAQVAREKHCGQDAIRILGLVLGHRLGSDVGLEVVAGGGE